MFSLLSWLAVFDTVREVRSWSVLWSCLCGIGVLFTVNVQNTFCLLLPSSSPLSPQKRQGLM